MSFPVIVTTASGLGTTLAGGVVMNMPASRASGDLVVVLASNDNPGTSWMTITNSEFVPIFSGSADGGVQRHHGWAAVARSGTIGGNLNGASQDYAYVTIRVTGHSVTQSTILTTIKVGASTSGSSERPSPGTLDAGSVQDWLWIATTAVDDDSEGAVPWWPTGYNAVCQIESAQSATPTMLQVAAKGSGVQTESPTPFKTTAAQVETWCWRLIAIAPAGAVLSSPILTTNEINVGPYLFIDKETTHTLANESIYRPKQIVGQQPTLDDFNRGNEQPITGLWSHPFYPYNSGLSLIGNRLTCGSMSGAGSYYDVPFDPDMQITFSNASGTGIMGFNLYWKLSTIPTGMGWSAYYLNYEGVGTTFTINRATSAGIIGDTTIGGPYTQVFTTGDSVRVRHVGSGIEVFIQSGNHAWASLATLNNNTLRNSGYVGIVMFDQSFDSFEGGNIPKGDTSSINYLTDKRAILAARFVPARIYE
jgi:hypothetical protein